MTHLTLNTGHSVEQPDSGPPGVVESTGLYKSDGFRILTTYEDGGMLVGYRATWEGLDGRPNVNDRVAYIGSECRVRWDCIAG